MKNWYFTDGFYWGYVMAESRMDAKKAAVKRLRDNRVSQKIESITVQRAKCC